MPLPIIAATSWAERTPDSGALGCFSRSFFVCLLESAFGVGAPTAVSLTGGSRVERGPNQRAAVCRIGSRNHQAASAPTRTTARQPSRTTPLRQPFTVFHLIHRAGGFERALHQLNRLDYDRRVEPQVAERRLEAGEVARAGLPTRPAERHMRTKRARLGGEAERGEFLLDAMLQDFEARVRGDARPDHAGPLEIGKHAEVREGERQGARPSGGAAERGQIGRAPSELQSPCNLVCRLL